MSPVPASAPPRQRGALRLTVDPAFGGLLWGKLLSGSGVWIHSIVASIVIYDETRSATMAGLVSVVQFSPQLLLGPLSGARSDRGGAVRQIRLGRLLCAVGSGSLALWMWLSDATGGNDVTVAVLATSLLVGFGFVVGGPAMQAIVPAMVTRAELATAMALNTAPMTVARIAGPAIGALVAATAPPGIAFGIAAATHGAFLLILLLIRLPEGPVRGTEVDHRVRAVFTHLRQDPPLVVLLLCVAAIGFGSETSMTLAPAVAHALGGDAHLVGAISSSFGAGAAVAVVLVAAMNRWCDAARYGRGGIWLMAGGLLLGASAETAPVVLVAFGVTGFGFSAALTGLSTLVQERCPDEARGRIMALWIIAFVGVRPLAALALGLLTDTWSLAAALFATAAMLLAVAIACRRRFMEPPSRAGVTARPEARSPAGRRGAWSAPADEAAQPPGLLHE